MDIGSILKIFAAGATIFTGLVALVKPKAIFGFTGLRVEGGRGLTEIRAFLGAALIAQGAAAIYFHIPETYFLLGMVYLGAAVTRLIAMFIDDSVVRSNIISIVVEIIFGVLLVFPG
jgi:hypothetical protein